MERIGTKLSNYNDFFGRKLSLESVIHIGIHILKQLRSIHSDGVIYNNLRPENIIIGKHAKVLDSVPACLYVPPCSDLISLINFSQISSCKSIKETASISLVNGVSSRQLLDAIEDSQNYMKPQNLARKNKKNDILNLGMLLVQMLDDRRFERTGFSYDHQDTMKRSLLVEEVCGRNVQETKAHLLLPFLKKIL